MDFKFKHGKTGHVKTLSLSESKMAELIDEDVLFDKFCETQCKCEPVGETNVIECDCPDYLEHFELIDS